MKQDAIWNIKSKDKERRSKEMELRVLKYFLMVAREENITKAARLLHITQPTLSRQLIQLEEELGVQLFHRGKYHVTLTNDGMLLKRRAQEIVALTEKTQKEFQNRDEELAGEIAIGCGETWNMTCLSKKMAEFREIHPLVQFQIYSANADDIKERMEIEDSPLARLDAVTPADLKGTPLIMASRENVKNVLTNWFGDDYEEVEVAASFNLLLNAANMVKNGVGAAFCFHLDMEYDGLRFVPLAPRLETGAVLAWKKNQIFSSAATRFIETLKHSI